MYWICRQCVVIVSAGRSMVILILMFILFTVLFMVACVRCACLCLGSKGGAHLVSDIGLCCSLSIYIVSWVGNRVSSSPPAPSSVCAQSLHRSLVLNVLYYFSFGDSRHVSSCLFWTLEKCKLLLLLSVCIRSTCNICSCLCAESDWAFFALYFFYCHSLCIVPIVGRYMLKAWRHVGFVIGVKGQEMWLFWGGIKRRTQFGLGHILLLIQPPLVLYPTVQDANAGYSRSIDSETYWHILDKLQYWIPHRAVFFVFFIWLLLFSGWDSLLTCWALCIWSICVTDLGARLNLNYNKKLVSLFPLEVFGLLLVVSFSTSCPFFCVNGRIMRYRRPTMDNLSHFIGGCILLEFTGSYGCTCTRCRFVRWLLPYLWAILLFKLVAFGTANCIFRPTVYLLSLRLWTTSCVPLSTVVWIDS